MNVYHLNDNEVNNNLENCPNIMIMIEWNHLSLWWVYSNTSFKNGKKKKKI